MNDQKNLAESIKGTLYLFQGNTIFTPNLESGCQDLSLRAAFNEWIIEKKTIYILKEQAINPFELQKSDELWITNAIQGIRPVSRYRKKNFTNTVALTMVELLNDRAKKSLN